jgi:hemerythrin-like domain-containing protein
MCVFDDYLGFHIEMEEKYIFPVLGMDHKMVKKALADHRRINRLLQDQNDMLKSMNSIEELLEQHIRFEDRMLFPEIEKIATPDQSHVIDYAKSMYSIYKEKEWIDKFW